MDWQTRKYLVGLCESNFEDKRNLTSYLEQTQPYLVVGSELKVQPEKTWKFNKTLFGKIPAFREGYLVVRTELYPFLVELNPITGKRLQKVSSWRGIDPLMRAAVAYLASTDALRYSENRVCDYLAQTAQPGGDFKEAAGMISRMNSKDLILSIVLNSAYKLDMQRQLGPFTQYSVTGYEWENVDGFNYHAAIEYARMCVSLFFDRGLSSRDWGQVSFDWSPV